MRNLKKFLALVLAMMMAFSLMVTVNASNFEDDDKINDAYRDSVGVLEALGVVRGDNGFRPKDTITRGEVAAILYRIATADVGDDNIHLYEGYTEFPGDVPATGVWYTPYINYCANNGLILGVGNECFEPKSPVTGYQALVMILRAMGYNNANEFSDSNWKFKASGYGRTLGITSNIAEGSLGGYATREMVAEIMFKGARAPMVNSNILGYSKVVLVENTDYNRVIYASAIEHGVELPICESLLHSRFDIVAGTQDGVDEFGRPATLYVKDRADDTLGGRATYTDGGGDEQTYIIPGTRYVANFIQKNDDGDGFAAAWDTTEEDWVEAELPDVTAADKAALAAEDCVVAAVAYKAVKKYDNVVTECDMTKDVNNDKTFTANYVWLNGTRITYSAATAAGIDGVAENDPYSKKVDLLHTVNTFINSQGRTLEVYKWVDNNGDTQWSLVFIDTFLGKVVDTRAKTVDTNGHTMHKAEADIAVGFDESADSALNVITVETDKYKVGDLVLVQVPDGAKDEDTDIVEFPIVTDVPATDAEFTDDAYIVPKDVQEVKGFTVLGTKIATKGSNAGGSENIKTGVEGANGSVYWLSNTYLAGADGTADGPVLDAYLTHVTNNLINRTFNLYLDHNGYVVGMQETTTSNVGVVTSVDFNRVGAGKYTVAATVTDVNGNEIEIELLDHDTTDDGFTTKNDFGFFDNQNAAEEYFDTEGLNQIAQEGETTAQDDKSLNAPILIEWTNVTMAGKQYQVITKVGTDAASADKDKVDGAAATPDHAIVRTGVTDTLGTAAEKALINDNTKFLIASYTVDYSAKPNENEGAMILNGYKPYTGFKTIPTINSLNTTVGEEVKWTKLTSNGQEYFAIFAGNQKKGYTMIEQEKFNPDNSYLMLASGTTYQFHSTYKALLNGEIKDVNVSNLNDVNTEIQGFMVGSPNVELITFKGKDASGNVNAVAASLDKGHFNDQLPDADFGTKGTTITAGKITLDDDSVISVLNYKAGVITVADGDDGDAAADIDYYYLTMADDAKVVIVNAAHGTTTAGTLGSINQYAKNTDGTNYFCYELDANGYISVLYIVD